METFVFTSKLYYLELDYPSGLSNWLGHILKNVINTISEMGDFWLENRRYRHQNYSPGYGR